FDSSSGLRGGQLGGFLASHLNQERATLSQPRLKLGGEFGVVSFPLGFPFGVLLEALDRLKQGGEVGNGVHALLPLGGGSGLLSGLAIGGLVCRFLFGLLLGLT